jgi:uncharacterized protein YkwD
MLRRFCAWLTALGLLGLGLLVQNRPAPISAAENTAIGDPILLEQADAPATIGPAFTGCTPVNVPPINWDFEQQVVELVNDHRASIGRPPLKRVNQLDAAARYHACDMRDDDYFSHDSKDWNGSSHITVCSFSQRIQNFYFNYQLAGENIAAGYPSPQAVMNGWLDSAGHRMNIERDTFYEIGVGYCAPGGYYGRYWVQNFGRRFNEYPLIIQREYSRTATPNVAIYIYGAWSQMRLRNDNGPWGAWQPFSNSFNWTLNWVQGMREVCAQLQSGSTTATACDTIELTTSAPSLAAQPSQVNFVYVLSSGQSFPANASVALSNPTNNQVLSWQRGTVPGWLNAGPASGNTPVNLLFALNGANVPNTPGLYQATVTYNATNATASTSVTVRLSVVNNLSQRRFVPVIRR